MNELLYRNAKELEKSSEEEYYDTENLMQAIEESPDQD